jgi:hypothetical protein
MDTKEFSTQLLSALSAANSFQNVSLSTEGPVVDGRAYVTDERFLNFYYNEETGTLAFALIHEDKRIWGVDQDNLRGWHLHPLNAPHTHIEIEPLTVTEIIAQLADILPGLESER